MTLPASGQIAFSDINTELGVGSTTTRSLNDAAVRTLFGQGSGSVDMNTGHGKANAVIVNLTIGSNTKNYNIKSAVGGSYSSGKTIVNLTINSGVIVGSTSTSTYALDTGSGWATGDVINITNNGYIAGHGGNGGQAKDSHSYPFKHGYLGTAGGSSINLQWNITTFSNTSGYVYSGGGGGGGGGAGDTNRGWKGGGGAGSSVGLRGVGTDVYEPAENGGLTHGGYGGWHVTGGYGSGGALNANGLHGFDATHESGGGGGGGGGGGASGGRGGNGSMTFYLEPGGAGGGHGKAINLNGHTINGTTTLTRTYGGIS